MCIRDRPPAVKLCISSFLPGCCPLRLTILLPSEPRLTSTVPFTVSPVLVTLPENVALLDVSIDKAVAAGELSLACCIMEKPPSVDPSAPFEIILVKPPKTSKYPVFAEVSLGMFPIAFKYPVFVSFDTNIGSFLKFWTWIPALRKDRLLVSLLPSKKDE